MPFVKCPIMLAFILFLAVVSSSPRFSFGQRSIGESSKEPIVRLETPDSTMATGFIINDPLTRVYLITNKHVIRSTKTNDYYDDIRIRNNVVSANGKITATEEKSKLYLKLKGKRLFLEHEDPGIDLVIIQLGNIRIDSNLVIQNPVGHFPALAFNIDNFVTRSIMDSLNIRDGTQIEIVGFSFEVAQKAQFQISRFGHIALFPREKMTLNWLVPNTQPGIYQPITTEWMVIDVTSRPGDSGAPVFAVLPYSRQGWIVGIVEGGSDLNEFCLAQPSYYITDLVDAANRYWK